MDNSHYVGLDVAPIIRTTPLSQRGPALARTIRSSTWFKREAGERFDSRLMNRLVRDLERSGPERVEGSWNKFAEFASRHNIWINEN